jgi:hypothetical protein
LCQNGGVGDWNEEGVPSDLIAFRLREAVWLFEIMKYRTKETKNLRSQEWKVEKGGKGAW